MLEIRLRLPPGISRALLANTLSLQPGTLSVELADDRLHLHVLDARVPVEPQFRRVGAHRARQPVPARRSSDLVWGWRPCWGPGRASVSEWSHRPNAGRPESGYSSLSGSGFNRNNFV